MLLTSVKLSVSVLLSDKIRSLFLRHRVLAVGDVVKELLCGHPSLSNQCV